MDAHFDALNERDEAAARIMLFIQMRCLRVDSNTIGIDREDSLRQHEQARQGLGGMFYAEMPTEKSSFVDTSKKSREIFVACPKCHRTLHESVVLYDGCYSCNR